MLSARTKTLIFALLLTLSSSQIVCAEVRLYKSNSNMPFIRMMLGMMDAMGVLDRVPTNSAYGGHPSSPWSNSTNSYMRNSQVGNPFTRSPWLQSPWSQSGLNNSAYDSPLWGSPSWGVLPTDSYAQNYYPSYDSQWSASDLDGWVNESWENSEWNPKTEKSARPTPTVQPTVPLVQNFNYNAPADTSQNNVSRKNSDMNMSSPLAKLTQPEHAQRPPASQPRKKPASPKKTTQKPCITEFCGLKKPSLDGLWVSQNGEMLGVKNKRYLWSDGQSRYLAGQLKVQNEYLIANVDGHEQLLRFKYKLAGNHLLTLQPDGTIREFVRRSYNQYQGQGQGNGQNYASPYYR